ncbi:MAG: hypothetical protein ABJN69_18010 [Hellea sp.]
MRWIFASVIMLTGCGGSTMNLYEESPFTASHENMVTGHLGSVKLTHADLKKLDKIKFCSTGATTVLEYIIINYENGVQKRFGFVNFGSKDSPLLRVSYKFDGDSGEDLKWPCKDEDVSQFHEFIFSKTRYVPYE